MVARGTHHRGPRGLGRAVHPVAPRRSCRRPRPAADAGGRTGEPDAAGRCGVARARHGGARLGLARLGRAPAGAATALSRMARVRDDRRQRRRAVHDDLPHDHLCTCRRIGPDSHRLSRPRHRMAHVGVPAPHRNPRHVDARGWQRRPPRAAQLDRRHPHQGDTCKRRSVDADASVRS